MLLFVVSCVGTHNVKNQPNTDELIVMYKSLPYHKAFAIARDKNGIDVLDNQGGRISGYSWGYANVRLAVNRAIAECSRILQKLSLKATCRLYAINNDLVLPTKSSPPKPGTITRSPTEPKDITKIGTCFAIEPDGTILTAYHVLKGASHIRIRLSNGNFSEVIHKKGSESIDLAILQIKEPTPNFLNLAPAGSVQVGDSVFTLGFPNPSILGNEPKYTNGTISSLSGLYGEATLMQTSVPIQPGNSGGPLVNENGQVVGIITSSAAALPFFKYTGSLPQNINWAIKADFVKPFLHIPETQPKKVFSLSNAIERVRKAICLVEATN